jgi:hypothetical protein
VNSLEKFKEEAAPYIGTLVIDEMWTVTKLIDVIDGEDDYYWVLKAPFKGTYYASCVGGWLPLKGKIEDSDYERLERIWKLNEQFWKE